MGIILPWFYYVVVCMMIYLRLTSFVAISCVTTKHKDIHIVFTHFTLTLCKLVTTQYEESWKNNRILYTYRSIYIYIPNYIQAFQKKRSVFLGVIVAAIVRKKIHTNICIICINAFSIMTTLSHDFWTHQEK